MSTSEWQGKMALIPGLIKAAEMAESTAAQLRSDNPFVMCLTTMAQSYRRYAKFAEDLDSVVCSSGVDRVGDGPSN